jgi:hypothetical protein
MRLTTGAARFNGIRVTDIHFGGGDSTIATSKVHLVRDSPLLRGPWELAVPDITHNLSDEARELAKQLFEVIERDLITIYFEEDNHERQGLRVNVAEEANQV